MGLDFDAAEHLEAVDRRVYSPELAGGPAHAVTVNASRKWQASGPVDGVVPATMLFARFEANAFYLGK